ncbi:upstream activation factor subunit UAF30-like [Impatiens glandulifera]|uniref:upstream activation factor subunit UAF30-like n=1 Tax=Impatiens glandulifera TaxID=253017 RepID=UPI001FB11503|nr:upstream activation factor subunit UAF30-like [Impatiens glandulifera]
MAIPLGMSSTFLFRVDATMMTKTTTSFPSSSPSLLRRRSFSVAATATTEKTTAKREPRGIMKPRRVSPEMQDFLGGVPEIARTQVLKEIWAYIKHHNLQDPENKKIIICDDNLKKIFSDKEQVGFLEIAKLIGPHFL